MIRIASKPALLAGSSLVALSVATFALGPWAGGEPGGEPGGPPVEATAPASDLALGPINIPLQDAMYRCGLDPRALAAAGVRPEQVRNLVAGVHASCADVEPVLSTADSGVAHGRGEVGRLSRLVRSGKGSQEDVAALRSAKTACDAALQERKNCLTVYHVGGCQTLETAQQQAVMAIRANRQWQMHEPYLVVNRTNEEWLELSDCIDVERILTNRGEEMDSGCAAMLAEARGNPRVAEALVSFDSNLAAVEAAFDQAVRDPGFASVVPSGSDANDE